MTEGEWFYLGLGILLGWLTKIPVFLHLYKEWQKESLDQYQISKRVLELIKKNQTLN